jgi:hypothetical protein
MKSVGTTGSLFAVIMVSMASYTQASGIQATLECARFTLNTKSPFYDKFKDAKPSAVVISIDNNDFAMGEPGKSLERPMRGVVAEASRIILDLRPIVGPGGAFVIDRQTLKLTLAFLENEKEEVIYSGECQRRTFIPLRKL